MVYDAASVLAVTDTLELSRLTRMVLAVVDLNSSRRSAVGRTGERPGGVGAELAGVVLNNYSARETYYGHYYSAYHGGGQEPGSDAASRVCV